MNFCYLSLGSNQKCPERQIRAAINALRALPSTHITQVSSLYWNKAWGLQTQQDFCNVVVEITSTLNPLLLLKFCQKIEQKQGRVRRKQWGPRALDIDIILYGSRKITTPRLTIPHPYFLERDFVIQPLLKLCTHTELKNFISSIALNAKP